MTCLWSKCIIPKAGQDLYPRATLFPLHTQHWPILVDLNFPLQGNLRPCTSKQLRKILNLKQSSVLFA